MIWKKANACLNEFIIGGVGANVQYFFRANGLTGCRHLKQAMPSGLQAALVLPRSRPASHIQSGSQAGCRRLWVLRRAGAGVNN